MTMFGQLLGQDLANEKMSGLILCCPFITSTWAGCLGPC